MKKIRILIADDHLLILKGIQSMLQSVDNLEIIGEATNGKEAVEKALFLRPEILFIDITMPGLSGIEACRQITSQNRAIKVIALSQHEDEAYVYQIIKAGAYGYMLKNSTREELITAVKTVLSGEKYFSPQISDRLINDLFIKKDRERNSVEQGIHLTQRELQIIKMIAEDLSNHEISDRLSISLRTTETHRRNIMLKLKVNSVVALVRYALKHELITLDDQ